MLDNVCCCRNLIIIDLWSFPPCPIYPTASRAGLTSPLFLLLLGTNDEDAPVTRKKKGRTAKWVMTADELSDHHSDVKEEADLEVL